MEDWKEAEEILRKNLEVIKSNGYFRVVIEKEELEIAVKELAKKNNGRGIKE